MNQTITTEELLALTKSADLLRQTAEQALRCDSLARELHNVRNDRDHLAGILEKVARVFDDPDEGPEDFHQLPQAVEGLRLKCETLKGEVVTAGNHAACRLNVLKDIHRVLGSDGGPTGVNTLTGVPPQMTRLPKRIEQILRELHSARDDRDHLAGILEKVARVFDRNPDAAPKDFADLPLEVLAQAQRCHEATEQRNQIMRDRDAIAKQRDRMAQDRDAWEDAANDWKERYHKEVCKNGDLVRENETLARNMPPEPPADSVFWNPYNGVVQDHRDGTVIQPDTDKERAKRGLPPFDTNQPTGFTKVIGQAWCKTDRATTDLVNFALKFDMQTHFIVLCEICQDTTTGALTYHPVGVKDLPIV